MGVAFTLLIVLAYAYVGYKLNKNFILWGLLGFGFLAGPPLLMLILMNFTSGMAIIELWPLTIVGSFLFSIVYIAWTVHENKAVFKRSPDQPS